MTFDLIIIGAGINGAGIARDAAMRGLAVLLVDKGDIGGGTSSWSTRLIHGGLRYLEHAELALVRESLREREILFKIAPHLIRPLPMLFPAYKNGRRGRWMLRFGMTLYDLLSEGKSLPPPRMLSRAQTLASAPGLAPEGLIGGALYYDAQVEFAERLVLENALSAQHHGAVVRTYAQVNRFIVNEGKVAGIEFTDLFSNERVEARARVTINAAGPWADEVAGTSKQPMIGGTKGSHIVVAKFAGAPATALYVEARADHRPFFIIPWNGNFLIGTTDKRFAGDLDEVRIDKDEIEYLLSETNRVIPEARLAEDAILFSYAGVRPLPYTTNKHEQAITRKHFIHHHKEPGHLFSIIGGKLTTYRNLAEEAVDLVFKTLHLKSPPSPTKETCLPGAEAFDFEALSKTLQANNDLSPATVDHLLRVYGTRAVSVVAVASRDPKLLSVFDDETGAIAAEVIFAFEQELAQTLNDCLLRRTMVGLNSSQGMKAVEAAASIARRYLNWSNSRAAREVDAYRHHVNQNAGQFKFSTGRKHLHFRGSEN